jgi:hypothetical protein
VNSIVIVKGIGWAHSIPSCCDGVVAEFCYRSLMLRQNPYLRELRITPIVLGALLALGFERLNDLRPLTSIQILRLPNMGGRSYKVILAALDRNPTVGGPTRERLQRS